MNNSNNPKGITHSNAIVYAINVQALIALKLHRTRAEQVCPYVEGSFAHREWDEAMIRHAIADKNAREGFLAQMRIEPLVIAAYRRLPKLREASKPTRKRMAAVMKVAA